MRVRHVVAGALLLLLVGRCGDAGITPDVTPDVTPVVPDATRESPAPSPPVVRADPAGGTTALEALDRLPVKGRAPLTGYTRERFGPAWLDADRNGCDTRNDVLREHLDAVRLEPNGCVVAAGAYADPYTGTTIDYRQGDGSLIDIDHVVPLANAWVTGASGWPITGRAAVANDPLNLLPADAGANRQKGDGDAATWLPPNRAFRCVYVSRQVAVKRKYGLWVTAPERAAIERVLASCPGQPLPPDVWRASTMVDHHITDPGDPSVPDDPVGAAPFDSCDAARAAGAAPVHVGDPGYGTHLDGDGDGTACE